MANTTISKPTLAERWDSIKPAAFALVVGLIAGPILSNMIGFQILSSTARERSQSAGVAVQAQICATQARIADPKAGELDWSARRDLADHWAIMPGAKEAAPGVSSACSDLLAG
ncbi:hypothetical protein [Ferrovibrio xuzhouensis]|uniref:Uncharacterized protein n=1 Tax=Ferrovibrio xuzhouensis TaxID=1576914 RepID=A0ABV7VE02_9PROT